MEKTEIIRIRSTKDLKRSAEEKADDLGVSLSAYITMLIKKDLKNEE